MLSCFFFFTLSASIGSASICLNSRTTVPCLVNDRFLMVPVYDGRGSLYSNLSAKIVLSFHHSEPLPKRTTKSAVSLIIHRYIAYNVVWMRMNQQVQQNWIKKWTATQTKYIRDSRWKIPNPFWVVKTNKQKKTPKKVLVPVSLCGLLNVRWQTGRNYIHAKIKSYEKIRSIMNWEFSMIDCIKVSTHYQRWNLTNRYIGNRYVYMCSVKNTVCVVLRIACRILISWSPTLLTGFAKPVDRCEYPWISNVNWSVY